ncbi:MAG TPA: GNAT family N-acetyltransferase [Acidimicrobiales bacterium]|nr:GNAT family N-acetyltransferase [Acidimicrobiales bacterium]
MPLPLPDPPLADDAIRLRPWGANDVDALVDAWADEEIQRWTRVPERRGAADALRWIAAEGLRRERGLSLDLVVSPADVADTTVLGEVGMVPLAGGPSRAELGWWVGAPYRRQHVATRAVGVFATWLREELAFTDLFAEVDPDNPASVWVAESNDLRLRIKK